MKDNMYLTKIVAASLLGDGCVTIPNDGSINAKYLQSKTEPHRDYVDWFCDRIENITRVTKRDFQPKMKNAKPGIQISTGVHPFYTRFRERMYGTGRKCVDPHYLTLVDWEFLAVWYQEDGTMNVRQRPRDRRRDIQISLATDCFSYGDQMLLKVALKEKLGLEWNIRPYTSKKGNRMYNMHLLRKQAELFCETIDPFIQLSFKYKISYNRPLIAKGDDIVESLWEHREVYRNDIPTLPALVEE